MFHVEHYVFSGASSEAVALVRRTCLATYRAGATPGSAGIRAGANLVHIAQPN